MKKTNSGGIINRNMVSLVITLFCFLTVAVVAQAGERIIDANNEYGGFTKLIDPCHGWYSYKGKDVYYLDAYKNVYLDAYKNVRKEEIYYNPSVWSHIVHRKGIIEEVLYYDSNGNKERYTCYYSNAYAAKFGGVKETTYYDSKGNKVKIEAYYTSTFAAEKGYSKCENYFYDSGKVKTIIEYYTNTFAAEEGYYKLVGSYDKQGNQQKRTYLDKHGNIIKTVRKKKWWHFFSDE